MPINIEALLVEINDIHSDHDIEQEVTDKVNAAVEAAVKDAVAAEVPADVATAIAPLQKQVDDQGTALKAIVDKLTGADQTELSSAVLAIAQNALASPNGQSGTSETSSGEQSSSATGDTKSEA